MNIYHEAIKTTRFNNLLDADICKLNALKIMVKESDKFTGRVENDYITGLEHCIEVLDSLRVLDEVIIKYEGNNFYRPIKNTTSQECYKLLYQLKCMKEVFYND